jgi:thiol-disulfide isomerase/thioredoxin/tetratricopeptide (TPR) repeat protein
MKTGAILFYLIVGLSAIGSAQTSYKNVRLSSLPPRQGDTIDITLDPGKTNIHSGKEVVAKVCFYTAIKYPQTEIVKSNSSADGYTYRLNIPADTKVLAISFSQDTVNENNKGAGYLFDIDGPNRASTDRAGIRAFIYTYGDEQLGILPDQEKALVLVKQQIQEYPSSKSTYNNIYFLCLAHSKNPKNQEVLQTELQNLLKSNDESDWQTVLNGYAYLKQKNTGDSIYQLELKKFPRGKAASGEVVKSIYFLTSASEMEKAYYDWLRRFPEENFKNDRIQYDYVRSSVASAYAREKDSVKAVEILNTIETDYYKSSAYNSIAGYLYQSNFWQTAKSLYKIAMDTANEYLVVKKKDNHSVELLKAYLTACTNYAVILYQQNNYPDALTYIEKAYAIEKENNSLNYYYSRILQANQKDQEAFVILDKMIRMGKVDEKIMDEFKTLYTKVKGSTDGYDAYITGIKEEIIKNFRARIAGKMIDKPSHPFILTDLNGEKVSLNDLRGKVVVLDFWATWCGPCKKSFPAMALTQKKFKDDPDVKFLFIHTWETAAAPQKDARSYIEGQHYDFEVLMDTKDPVTKKNNVVESYGVTGIPAKFIIDKKGHIRFQLAGFSGDTNESVEELSTMIQLVKDETTKTRTPA